MASNTLGAISALKYVACVLILLYVFYVFLALDVIPLRNTLIVGTKIKSIGNGYKIAY